MNLRTELAKGTERQAETFQRIELQRKVRQRAFLFVFENLASSHKELVAFEGKTSVILAVGGSSPAQCSLEETAAVFSRWGSNFDRAINAFGSAQHHIGKLPEYTGERRRTAISLGSAASSCLRHAGRLAEAHELLELTIESVRATGDLFTAARLEWEKSWILEEWGAPIPPSAGPILAGCGKTPHGEEDGLSHFTLEAI